MSGEYLIQNKSVDIDMQLLNITYTRGLKEGRAEGRGRKKKVLKTIAKSALTIYQCGVSIL